MAHSGFFIGPAVLPALKVIIHNKTDIQPSGLASWTTCLLPALEILHHKQWSKDRLKTLHCAWRFSLFCDDPDIQSISYTTGKTSPSVLHHECTSGKNAAAIWLTGYMVVNVQLYNFCTVEVAAWTSSSGFGRSPRSYLQHLIQHCWPSNRRRCIAPSGSCYFAHTSNSLGNHCARLCHGHLQADVRTL